MIARPKPAPDDFRLAMSHFATGVTVMTTHDDGVPHGMTASAVSSVSLEPLLVLVCVERDTGMVEWIESGCFALSILNGDQQELSVRFAESDRPVGEAMFEGVATTTLVTGAPLIEGALAWLDCTVWATYDGGDHVIVVGEVVDLLVGEASSALLYLRSRYVDLPLVD